MTSVTKTQIGGFLARQGILVTVDAPLQLGIRSRALEQFSSEVRDLRVAAVYELLMLDRTEVAVTNRLPLKCF